MSLVSGMFSNVRVIFSAYVLVQASKEVWFLHDTLVVSRVPPDIEHFTFYCPCSDHLRSKQNIDNKQSLTLTKVNSINYTVYGVCHVWEV